MSEIRNRIGKAVRVQAGNYPGTSPNETYTVATATSPQGSSAVFVQLTDSRGRAVKGWFKETDLLPAPAPKTPPAEARIMKAATDLRAAHPTMSLADAVKEAARLDLSASKAWRDSIDAGTITQLAVDKVKATRMSPRAAVTAVLREQRAQQEASRLLNTLSMAYAQEHRVSLTVAAKEIARRHPELCAVAR
jgi:hypothetical protein